LPAVITTDLRLNEPRYVTLPNIMKAKKKTLDIVKPEDLGVDVKPRIKTLKVSEPPKRGAGVKVADVAALVDKLKKVSKLDPQPEVQIRGDMASRYEGVGKILYACQRAGIVKVAFITEPPALGG